MGNKTAEEQRAYNAMYYAKNKAKIRQQTALYAAKRRTENKDAVNESARALYRRRRVGDIEKDRARLRKNRGLPTPTRQKSSLCECCNRPSGKKAFALDHCHVSNQFRGWLCDRCNAGIGMLGDSIDGLMNAVRYLERAAKQQET
jgi:Recombination endonuclease VII